MTRKNVSDGIIGTLCKPCPCCNGLGYVKSEETIRLDVERKIRKLAKESFDKAFLIKLNPSIAAQIIGKGGQNLKNLESLTRKYLAIKSDENLPLDAFIIESQGDIADIQEASRPFKIGDIIDIEVEKAYSHNRHDALSRVEGYVIQIINGRQQIGKWVKVEITAISKTSAVGVIKA